MFHLTKSPSDIAYLRALAKSRVFQELTDSTSSKDVGEEVIIKKAREVEQDLAIVAQNALRDVDDFLMAYDDAFSTSTSPFLEDVDESEFFISAATFKFWFIILLIFFLLISVAIFHFVCMGNQNVTRRNSLDKGMPTASTTLEMLAEPEESRLVLEDV